MAEPRVIPQQAFGEELRVEVSSGEDRAKMCARGVNVFYGDNHIFANPREQRTSDYITGRYG